MNKNQLAITLLRVMLGVTFLMHGLAKWNMSLAAVSGWFESIGLPGALAYAVTFAEIIGGILLILGLMTRWAAVAVGAILLGAIATVKASAGFLGTAQAPGYELDAVLLVIAAFFAITGLSGVSLDQVLAKKNGRGAAQPPNAL